MPEGHLGITQLFPEIFIMKKCYSCPPSPDGCLNCRLGRHPFPKSNKSTKEYETVPPGTHTNWNLQHQGVNSTCVRAQNSFRLHSSAPWFWRWGKGDPFSAEERLTQHNTHLSGQFLLWGIYPVSLPHVSAPQYIRTTHPPSCIHVPDVI